MSLIDEVVITREPDDPAAVGRISIGQPKGYRGAYMTFRGDPEQVLQLLHEVMDAVERALPSGNYRDRRGRPQG